MGHRKVVPEEGKTYWVLYGHPSKVICLPMAVTVKTNRHENLVSCVGLDPWSGKKVKHKNCPTNALYRTERAALRATMKATDQTLARISKAVIDGREIEQFYKEQYQAQKERWNQIVPEKFKIE